MINNERQYKISKLEADRFKEALDQHDEIELIKQGIDPLIAAAQREALSEQLSDLNEDIARYEALRSGEVKEFLCTDASKIGDMLIEARISKGLSQRELAATLGMKEQQIQRYEQEKYLSANLVRVNEVLLALSLSFSARCELVQKNEPSDHDHSSEAIEKLSFEPEKLPVRTMLKRGWLRDLDIPKADFLPAPELAAEFVRHAHRGARVSALLKQHVRINGKYNPHAFLAWKSRILQKARKSLDQAPLLRNAHALTLLDAPFFKQLVKLSTRSDGPVEAVKCLREVGVIVVIEEHLPETHLDGAAMLINDAIPVIGMTIRLDRVDNFWFVLMHELAHIVRHWERGLKDGFCPPSSPLRQTRVLH
jgi:HTH-type transcriptional regulator/antitoxin HigA